MKNLLLIASLFTAALGAWAQGKIDFVNDSLHLVYFNSDPSWLQPADVSMAGQAVPASGVTPSGITLAVDLWGGTSSSSLTKLTTTTMGGLSGGRFGPVNFTSSLAGGTPAYFQVLVYDVAAGSYYAAAAAANYTSYYGESPIFTMVPGASLTYDSIVNPNPPSDSTWAPGAWNMDSSYGAGARGAIAVQVSIPEPSTLALAGLGLALLAGRWARKLSSQG